LQGGRIFIEKVNVTPASQDQCSRLQQPRRCHFLLHTHCSCDPHCFSVARQPPKLLLSLERSGPPFSTWFLWPTRIITHLNCIAIGSAVFVGLTNVSDRHADEMCYSVCSKRPHLAVGAMWPETFPSYNTTSLCTTYHYITTNRCCLLQLLC